MTEKAGGAKRTDARAVLGAGSKAYGWVKNALGFYGTAVTLVQLVPAIVALLLVFLSPTAWLSATLRRWVAFGALAGALVGMAVFARAAGPRQLKDLVLGAGARSGRLAGVAWWGLGVGLAAAAALRLHLAVVDVAFVNAVPFLTPVLDFYLGGGAGAATSYNALAAGLAGLTLAGVVSGAPAAVLRWRERRAARLALLGEGGALAALDTALKSLESAKAAVESSRAQIVALSVELEDLKAGAGAPATSAAARPDRRAPAAAGRTRRSRT